MVVFPRKGQVGGSLFLTIHLPSWILSRNPLRCVSEDRSGDLCEASYILQSWTPRKLGNSWSNGMGPSEPKVARSTKVAPFSEVVENPVHVVNRWNSTKSN